MKIYYGKAIYDNKEISAAVRVLKRNSLNLVDGPSVKKLEEKIAKLFGKKYGLMVNSGSSANLLALSSFNFKKGSEIITPNLTFSTTVAPIYQLGLIPHFVGTEENKFITDNKIFISNEERSLDLNVINNYDGTISLFVVNGNDLSDDDKNKYFTFRCSFIPFPLF